MTAPTIESTRTQCRGYKQGGPCNQEPRFRISYGTLQQWACGWHATAAVVWISDQAASGAPISVQVLW